MRFKNNYLTYCMNIHPIDSAEKLIQVLDNEIVQVKQKVCPDAPFGLGMWISATTLEELHGDTLSRLLYILEKNSCYIMTLNAFPYGAFHGEVVKEKVYLPHWGEAARLDYTCGLIRLLEKITPPENSISISTVPVCYGKTLPDGAIENIKAVAELLHEVNANRSGKISLAFEPEPDCYLDSTGDCLDFFAMLIPEIGPNLTENLGVCLDTCHFAVCYESPFEAWKAFEKAGILVPKVQLSAALKATSSDVLKSFVEPTYLHQARVKQKDGIIEKFADLPLALNAEGEEWRVHFHVPLYAKELSPGLSSTADCFDTAFISCLLEQEGLHLEIETYSFDVLPEKVYGVIESITREIEFVTGWQKIAGN